MADLFELFKKIKRPEIRSGGISYIIAGLGNPGVKYARTRHNAGFMAIDYICQKCGVECKKLKFRSLNAEATVAGVRVLLMKPQTYMNRSGEAIREAAEYYKVSANNIIVIVDDVQLDTGRIRIRSSGSAGGHNGLKNIIEQLNTEAFPRIRIGVGEKPSPETDMRDWVLAPMSKPLLEKVYRCLEASYDTVGLIMNGRIDEAMAKYNGMRFENNNEH